MIAEILSLIEMVLLIVPSAFTTLIVPMACQASVTSYAIGMAGTAGRAAMIDARASFFYAGFRVRQIEARRAPGRG